ncbi:MAG: peptide chain release factor N(5)-glutamine methyltransferase [Paracoccus denitrificans]|uniref:Release factor glutamine methyltransferase n=1 Tax=Paracoccus denitrificans TaxID=266 RepID=A0A533IDA3_PARDE|nr:MAG: peptide chain release factor N(5)-glutamine methyltransferase [Paracoccus denitrificans]
MTWLEWFAEAERRLALAAVDDPKSEARAIFGAVIPGNTRYRTALTDPVHADKLPEMNRILDARVQRQPLSQITGRRAFWKHDFRVTGDTLDPRPDTETLVEAALELPWQSVLDLGTGTGAILISLLAERPGATGMATDISDAALMVARENAARIGVQAEFALADWFDGVTGSFDLIVSNPPYIALSEMASLQPEVRIWEPHLALTDGGDGLGAYRIIAASARRHLNPGGQVLVETGWKQAADICAIFAEVGAATAVLQDLAHRDRVIRATFDETLP